MRTSPEGNASELGEATGVTSEAAPLPEVEEEGPAPHGDGNPPTSLYSTDLAPTSLAKRTWTAYHFAALWFGMAQCVPTYGLTSGLLAAGMNWWQALLTILLGNLIILVPMLLIAHGGARYGIPFSVLCRASFGVRGANIPVGLRGLVACAWFGIQTWIGGQAINRLLIFAFPAWKTNDDGEIVCFFAFWVLNMAVIWTGMNALRRLVAWTAPAVLLSTLFLLFSMFERAHGLGPIIAQPGFTRSGEWINVWPILLAAQIGFWSTLSLNMSDFTRYAKNQRAQLVGQAIGLPTAMTLFAGLGMAITSATASVYLHPIWDPVTLLTQPEFGNPFVVIWSLLTIVLATLTVNVAANLIAPAFGFAHLWPQKIYYRIGASIAGALAVLMQPWFLLEQTGDLIAKFLVGYSALLGPIAGILICDYWLLRRARLNVDDLFLASGRYRYRNGFNQLALSALLAGIFPNLPGFILNVQAAKLGIPSYELIAQQDPSSKLAWHLADDFYGFAWLLGFVVSFCVYAILMRAFEREQYEADRR